MEEKESGKYPDCPTNSAIDSTNRARSTGKVLARRQQHIEICSYICGFVPSQIYPRVVPIVMPHCIEGTRTKVQQVVVNYYAANVSNLTPGKMLLSPRFTPSLAEQWCKGTRIILREALRA